MIIHTSEGVISRLPHVQLDSSFQLRDIVHMILAGGPSQTLYNLSTGIHQRAVEFLCREAHGAIRENDRGLPYFALDRTHRLNETLGIFTIAGVRLSRTPMVTSKGNEGTLQDLADSAKLLFDNDSSEKSWSLMLFSISPGVTAEWVNEKGERQSVERILKNELSRPHGSGCCFGTHRLEGISFALRRFCLEQDFEPNQLNGIWLEAYEYLQNAVCLMKQNQRYDGAFPRTWFRKKSLPVNSLELRETFSDLWTARRPEARLVYATGHCLDAMSPVAEFLTDEKEWIGRACYILASTIETHWTSVCRPIAPLTHAIHALKLLDV
jgi:hypothetical protein